MTSTQTNPLTHLIGRTTADSLGREFRVTDATPTHVTLIRTIGGGTTTRSVTYMLDHENDLEARGELRPANRLTDAESSQWVMPEHCVACDRVHVHRGFDANDECIIDAGGVQDLADAYPVEPTTATGSAAVGEQRSIVLIFEDPDTGERIDWDPEWLASRGTPVGDNDTDAQYVGWRFAD